MKIDTSTYEWTAFFDQLEKLKVGEHMDSPVKWFRAIVYSDGLYIMWTNCTAGSGLGRILKDSEELRKCIDREVWSGIIITY